MKTIVFRSLLPCLFALGLFAACSKPAPTVGQVDTFAESMTLRIEMCKQSYDRFTALIPEKHDLASNIGVNASFDVMLKSFDEQKQLLDKVKLFESTEEHVEQSRKLKEATTLIVDTYIAGGKNEIKKAKQLINDGKTINSEEVINLLGAFEVKLNEAYGKFSDQQKIYAKKYGITLY